MTSAQNLYHSPIFVRFVKVAVMPAVLLFLAKLVSLIFFAGIYGLQYSIGSSGIEFNDFNSFKMANDYSSAITFLVAFSFTSWLVFKGFYLHHSHITPALSAWLHGQGLENLIAKNVELFVKLAVWVIFMWVVTILVVIHYFLGLTSDWVLYSSLVLSAILTVLSIIDIEKEHAIFVRYS